jgi:hypothetical protein
MNARSNSAAPAPSVARLIALITIGELTLAHHHASSAANTAKRHYHEAIAKHESQFDEQPYVRIDPRDPECAPVIAASKKQFDAYQAAKRIAYNIKRRLDNACRKAAQS